MQWNMKNEMDFGARGKKKCPAMRSSFLVAAAVDGATPCIFCTFRMHGIWAC